LESNVRPVYGTMASSRSRAFAVFHPANANAGSAA
jgi:hypothetical protein